MAPKCRSEDGRIHYSDYAQKVRRTTGRITEQVFAIFFVQIERSSATGASSIDPVLERDVREKVSRNCSPL